MEASKENPIYSVYLVHGSKKYDLTPALIELGFSEQKRQLAKSATVEVADIKTDGKFLSQMMDVRDRVFIYADDGEEDGEVWRGYVWAKTTRSRTEENLLSLRCYDNLIYWQESEDSEYYAAGRTTAQVVGALCSKWGVTLNYRYESITHDKLVLRGTLSDILLSDVLDLARDRTGKKYVVRSEKDAMVIQTVGQNTRMYTVKDGSNAVEASSSVTMDGMVTKVAILGKAGKDDRSAVEGTESGRTDAYGTLQKIISRSENTSIEDCRKEAKNIIKEDGLPKKEYEIVTVDIPWIRKGDYVKAEAGGLSGRYLVTGIDRSLNNRSKRMTLTMEDI